MDRIRSGCIAVHREQFSWTDGRWIVLIRIHDVMWGTIMWDDWRGQLRFANFFSRIFFLVIIINNKMLRPINLVALENWRQLKYNRWGEWERTTQIPLLCALLYCHHFNCNTLKQLIVDFISFRINIDFIPFRIIIDVIIFIFNLRARGKSFFCRLGRSFLCKTKSDKALGKTSQWFSWHSVDMNMQALPMQFLHTPTVNFVLLPLGRLLLNFVCFSMRVGMLSDRMVNRLSFSLRFWSQVMGTHGKRFKVEWILDPQSVNFAMKSLKKHPLSCPSTRPVRFGAVAVLFPNAIFQSCLQMLSC